MYSLGASLDTTSQISFINVHRIIHIPTPSNAKGIAAIMPNIRRGINKIKDRTTIAKDIPIFIIQYKNNSSQRAQQ